MIDSSLVRKASHICVCSRTKTNKKTPIKIKQFKNIINTNILYKHKFFSNNDRLCQGDISVKIKGNSLPYCNNY